MGFPSCVRPDQTIAIQTAPKTNQHPIQHISQQPPPPPLCCCRNISASLLPGRQPASPKSHSIILFVRCKTWRETVRSKTTCTYLCPRTPGAKAEKAQRINLRFLQLSPHTLLYLFNHTCRWTINNKNSTRTHTPSVCFDPVIQRTVTGSGAHVWTDLSSSLKNFSICYREWICDRPAV